MQSTTIRLVQRALFGMIQESNLLVLCSSDDTIQNEATTLPSPSKKGAPKKKNHSEPMQKLKTKSNRQPVWRNEWKKGVIGGEETHSHASMHSRPRRNMASSIDQHAKQQRTPCCGLYELWREMLTEQLPHLSFTDVAPAEDIYLLNVLCPLNNARVHALKEEKTCQ